MITLIGMGSGTPGSLTAQGLAALQGADRILGAKRLLATLPEGCTGNRQALYKPDEILACLAAHPDEEIALVYSGDTGFYSGASQLLPMLRAFGISCRVLPGLSSVQLLAAAVGRPWQDWTLVSAHGCACDPVSACMNHKTVFFLTGGAETPATLCAALTAAGLGDAHALVGENLGTPAEAIRFGLARELAEQTFAPLSVLQMCIRDRPCAVLTGKCAPRCTMPPPRMPVWRFWIQPGCGSRCCKACLPPSSCISTAARAGRSGWARCCFQASTARWDRPKLPPAC